MSHLHRTLRLLVVGLLFGLVSVSTWGEIAPDRTRRPKIDTLVMSGVITEGMDPIPQVDWQVYRPLPPHMILNASGDVRGDGRPDFTFRVASGWPVVVWAYNNGPDHDIAYAEWTGNAWSPVEFLTSGPEDEIDPRVLVGPDGTVHVAYWIPGAVDRVLRTTRTDLDEGVATANIWQTPVVVTPTGVPGRRPSLAIVDGILRVAYERDSVASDAAQEVVVRRTDLDTESALSVGTVASTPWTGRLDAMITTIGGRVWVSWKHGPQVFGYAEFTNGGWGPVQTRQWIDQSWVGEEVMRRVIKTAILHQQIAVPGGLDP